jgi:RNA polymerase sigma-70 factor (ECF subfamily)
MTGKVPGREAWPALMQAAQDGDQAAYACLLRAMIPVIRAMLRRRVADDALIDDIIQEVLMSIHRVRHTYDPARPIMPWMSAIVSARAIDALRKRGRHDRRETADEEAMMARIDPHAIRRMESFAIDGELDGLLGVLPARQREIVELVRLREMSLVEAAEASSSSVSAVKALLHRAFTKLRQHGIRDHG